MKPRPPERRHISAPAGEFSYTLERKRVKNLNLRIREGGVFVSAPPRVPGATVDAFVRSRADTVLSALAQLRVEARQAPPPRRYVTGETLYILGQALTLTVSAAARSSVRQEGTFLYLDVRDPDDWELKRRTLEHYLAQRALEEFGQKLTALYPAVERLGAARPTLKVRAMKSRWGSCARAKAQITLNTRLLAVPPDCVELVLLHELCHLLRGDHSSAYYALLTALLPDWKRRRETLRRWAAQARLRDGP